MMSSLRLMLNFMTSNGKTYSVSSLQINPDKYTAYQSYLNTNNMKIRQHNILVCDNDVKVETRSLRVETI